MLTGEIKSELPKNISEDKGNSNLKIRIILRNQIYFIFAAFMKLFACMLSLYLMALTAIPCVDVPRDSTLHRIELSKNTSSSHQHEKDHCSPFCSCSCCASTVIYQTHTIQFNSFPPLIRLVSGNVSAFYPSFHTAIWQPPKFS
jgi:hypothetical protein